MKKAILFLIMWVIFLFSYDKKIIYSGWDSPTTEFVKENWKEMDKVPIDGFSLRITIDRKGPIYTGNDLGWNLGGKRKFKFEDFKEAIEDMKDVKFKNLKDIFLTIQPNCGYSEGLTWFDDERWDIFLNNIEVITKIAKEIKAVGLIIDFEAYNYNLFHYPFHKEKYLDKSWEEYCEKAFEKGQETIKRINKIYPDIKIYFYYSWELILNEMKKYKGDLKNAFYGLLFPYLEGMLSASDRRTIFYNGYELSYGYKNEASFKEAKKMVIEEGIKITKYPDKFKKQVKMGYGLWIDNRSVWDTKDFENNYFTPEEWENSLGYALKYADEYVWIYSQKAKFFTLKNVPEEYLDAFRNVKRKNWKEKEVKREKQYLIGKWEPTLKTEEYINRNPRYKEENVFKEYYNKFEFIMDLPIDGWKFITDKENKGEKEGYFKEDFDDKNWRDIKIAQWWEDFGINYDGYAWYRGEFEVNKDILDKNLYLVFGAVDESCKVWINGIFVGEHDIGETGWNIPFKIDITGKLREGKNKIVIKVFDSSNYGGIWQKIKIFKERK
ncbi:MAG: beta galactosidase jelly roll domain-containing protein [Candidatus Omnitrophica bacterium]|nr:beta galactosidase jelly roll domain-containing protein [Candidatus Omnitrophota bacterium]